MGEVEVIQLLGDLTKVMGTAELAHELENIKRVRTGSTNQRQRRASDGRMRGAAVVVEGKAGTKLRLRPMINGKRRQITAATQDALDRKLKELTEQTTTATPADGHLPQRSSRRDPPATLGDGLARFLAQYPHSERSEAALEANVQRVLKRDVPDDTRGRVVGDLSPFEADTETLQLVLNDMAAHGNSGGGYAKTTIRNTVAGTRQLFGHGEVAWGWPNNAKGLVVPVKGLTKLSPKDVHPYRSWDEVYALAQALEKLRHPELSRWLRWTCGTGERIQESIAKRACDISRANQEARVHRAVVNGVETELTKCDSAAVYYLTDVALEVVDEIPPDLRRDPLDWQNSPLLFPWHGDGGLIDVHALRRRGHTEQNDGIWRQAHALAGLAYRPPKQMRHTFAYLALTGGGENGDPALRWALEDVSTQLRHSSTLVTEEYYLDLVPQMLRRSREQMAVGAKPFRQPQSLAR